MDSFTLLGTGWILASLIMTALFLVAIIKKEADIVDVGWAGCIGILSLWYQLFSPVTLGSLLVTLCCLFWSTRLTTYLFRTRFLVHGEDGRYKALRASWGKKANINFFIFFQLQAALSAFFSIPVLIALIGTSSSLQWTTSLYVGLFIFIVSLVGETIADRQLSSFRRDPQNAGKVCNTGLWRYSRHPNYFFEWLHWWSYVAFASIGEYWWISLIGPSLLLYLILYVTGIPPTEARAIESRGEAYREYQRTTSSFFPWYPRK